MVCTKYTIIKQKTNKQLYIQQQFTKSVSFGQIKGGGVRLE